MKLAAFFLAAPVVLQLVAADPQPTPRPNQARRALERWEFERQLPTGGGSSANPPGGNSQTEKETSTPTPTSTPTSTSTPAPTPTPTSTRDEESSTSRTTADQQSTTPTQEQSSPTPSSTSQAQSQNTPTQSSQSRTTAPVNLSTPSPSPSQLVTTNEQGSVITSVVLVTKPASAVGPSSTSNDSESKPISKGTIIGLGVTGGIAVLIVVLLIVWKLTNKRFSDLEDTGDDAIKWPELNKDSAAMTPLPARPTGRSGVETSALDDFDSQSAAHSTADLTGTHYQPYSDDPGYGARPQYYDPYGGAAAAARPYASPPGSHDGDHKNWGGPADGQGYADPHQQYYDAPGSESRT
ncbi:hypothetical protein FRC08_010345 [Ceratobasidium sp. 394]|nr:hypothetical protein FRC08_010345 [Ceratobasidium sp. 394]